MSPRLLVAVLLASLLLAACAAEPRRGTGTTERVPPERGSAGRGSQETTAEASTGVREGGGGEGPAPDGPDPTFYGFTYGAASGNRVVRAEEGLSGEGPARVELGGGPAWVVGVPVEDDTVWAVAYGTGEVVSFRLDGETRRVTPYLTAPDALPPEAPPALAATGERLMLLQLRDGSPVTHPVPFGGGVVGVGGSGELVGGGASGLRALPDARPVLSEDGAAAILTEPTARYQHGVLGDELEAGSITVLDGGEATTIRPASGGVFEALAPLWFRPASGEPELLAVTESVEGEGTRVAVYDPGGDLVAAGPYAGGDQMWRHLMAAAPFGPEGRVEIVATLTPHLDPRTEVYRLEGERLTVVSRNPGFPTHTIYSRNLDAARAADVDGDGDYELAVPGQDYESLEILDRTRAGMEPSRTLPLGFTLTTNIASTTDSRGRLYLAAGSGDGVLSIFF